MSDISDDLDLDNMPYLEAYGRQQYTAVGAAYHTFVTKYGHHCFLINQEDYSEIFLNLWRKDTITQFDYFQRPEIAALEAFAVAYILTDASKVPFSTRLDALISLTQFLPVPSSLPKDFTHNIPNDVVEKDQVLMLLEISMTGLCKLADAHFISHSSLVETVDMAFGGQLHMKWATVKNWIILDHDINLFLRGFVDLLYLPELQTTFNQRLKTIETEFAEWSNPLKVHQAKARSGRGKSFSSSNNGGGGGVSIKGSSTGSSNYGSASSTRTSTSASTSSGSSVSGNIVGGSASSRKSERSDSPSKKFRQAAQEAAGLLHRSENIMVNTSMSVRQCIELLMTKSMVTGNPMVYSRMEKKVVQGAKSRYSPDEYEQLARIFAKIAVDGQWVNTKTFNNVARSLIAFNLVDELTYRKNLLYPANFIAVDRLANTASQQQRSQPQQATAAVAPAPIITAACDEDALDQAISNSAQDDARTFKRIMHFIEEFHLEKHERHKNEYKNIEQQALADEFEASFCMTRMMWIEYQSQKFFRQIPMDKRFKDILLKLTRTKNLDNYEQVNFNVGMHKDFIQDVLVDMLEGRYEWYMSKFSPQSKVLALEHIKFIDEWALSLCDVNPTTGMIKWEDILNVRTKLEEKLEALLVYYKALLRSDTK